MVWLRGKVSGRCGTDWKGSGEPLTRLEQHSTETKYVVLDINTLETIY